jgi:AbrB family looped-hinge helix DNA binding protein
MLIKIDKAGRIVVPKRMRDRHGLKPSAAVEAIEQADGVLLRVAEQRPSMIKVAGLWVHQGAADSGVNWDRILEEVRAERDEFVSEG